jgi:hypothetical protein
MSDKKPQPDTDLDQGEIGKELEPERDPYEVIDPQVAWRGLPEFRPMAPREHRVIITCDDEAAKKEVVSKLGLVIAKKTKETWSALYPPRPREDLSSLLFATDADGAMIPPAPETEEEDA